MTASAQTKHDRLQLFIRAARSGRHSTQFTSDAAAADRLAWSLITDVGYLTIPQLEGMIVFLSLARSDPAAAQLLVTPNYTTTKPADRERFHQPTNFRRSAK